MIKAAVSQALDALQGAVELISVSAGNTEQDVLLFYIPAAVTQIDYIYV